MEQDTEIEDDEAGDYRDKSPAASRMGKAAEYLVAAACILASRGELNAATSLIDDEGVDLVFNRRDHSATLAVQVKARMSDSKMVGLGRLQAQVRANTFRPRHDLDMLFLAVDVDQGLIRQAWLVPSPVFAALTSEPNSRGNLRFSASMKPATADKWLKYRLTAPELAPRILARLTDLTSERQERL